MIMVVDGEQNVQYGLCLSATQMTSHFRATLPPINSWKCYKDTSLVLSLSDF